MLADPRGSRAQRSLAAVAVVLFVGADRGPAALAGRRAGLLRGGRCDPGARSAATSSAASGRPASMPPVVLLGYAAGAWLDLRRGAAAALILGRRPLRRFGWCRTLTRSRLGRDSRRTLFFAAW